MRFDYKFNEGAFRIENALLFFLIYLLLIETNNIFMVLSVQHKSLEVSKYSEEHPYAKHWLLVLINSHQWMLTYLFEAINDTIN